MDNCANTYYLNKYLEDIDKTDKVRECFYDDIADRLQAIDDIIKELEAEAKDYEGFDFSEDLKECLEDLI